MFIAQWQLSGGWFWSKTRCWSKTSNTGNYCMSSFIFSLFCHLWIEMNVNSWDSYWFQNNFLWSHQHSNAHVSHSVWDSPSPHVVLNALVRILEHPMVLFFTKKDIWFEQILIEGVHTSSQTTLLANPLTCLDIYYIPWRRTMIYYYRHHV